MTNGARVKTFRLLVNGVPEMLGMPDGGLADGSRAGGTEIRNGGSREMAATDGKVLDRGLSLPLGDFACSKSSAPI